eukprot:scaffold11316_cov60-Attheya_sp.AAC.3
MMMPASPPSLSQSTMSEDDASKSSSERSSHHSSSSLLSTLAAAATTLSTMTGVEDGNDCPSPTAKTRGPVKKRKRDKGSESDDDCDAQASLKDQRDDDVTATLPHKRSAASSSYQPSTFPSITRPITGGNFSSRLSRSTLSSDHGNGNLHRFGPSPLTFEQVARMPQAEVDAKTNMVVSAAIETLMRDADHSRMLVMMRSRGLIGTGATRGSVPAMRQILLKGFTEREASTSSDTTRLRAPPNMNDPAVRNQAESSKRGPPRDTGTFNTHLPVGSSHVDRAFLRHRVRQGLLLHNESAATYAMGLICRQEGFKNAHSARPHQAIMDAAAAAHESWLQERQTKKVTSTPA